MVEKTITAVGKVYSMGVDHPITAAGVSLVASVVTVLQSVQELMGTLIALVSSVAALVTAIMAVRGAFKKGRE